MQPRLPIGDIVKILRNDDPEFLRASIKRLKSFVFMESGRQLQIRVSLEDYDLEIKIDSQDGLKSLELRVSPKLLARILEEYGKQLARSGTTVLPLAKLHTSAPTARHPH